MRVEGHRALGFGFRMEGHLEVGGEVKGRLAGFGRGRVEVVTREGVDEVRAERDVDAALALQADERMAHLRSEGGAQVVRRKELEGRS